MRRILSVPLLAAAIALPSPAFSQSLRHSNTRSNVPESIRTQTADQQVLQVLNRLAFGPRPGEVAAVRKIGVDAWIDQQLHPERIDDAQMDQLLTSAYPLLTQDQSKLAADYTAAQRELRQVKRADAADSANGAAVKPRIPPELKEAQRERGQLGAELASARVARAVGSNRQLLEVMTDFWENHFNVYARKNAVEAYYLADYDRTIREHALGKFRDLLGAVAHSPAMLVYLDNALSRANPGEPTLAPARGRGAGLAAFGPNGPTEQDVDNVIARRHLDATQAMALRQRFAQFQANRKKQGAKKSGGLNENYGRELMELHTLGVDGGYTQKDVIEVARALTGWTVRPPAQGGGFVFRPEWHDAGEKVILGQKFPAGHGEDEGERVLDIIARSPATAHFISRELCERFVSDSPSTALVDRAAQTFLRTDGDMREVLRTIVTSPEFFSAQAYHSKVKSPFEVVVSAARALGAEPDTTARTAFAVSYLGEPLFGHEAPNGWPETGESWMNTGGILNRINFGMAVAANRLPGATIMGVPGADTLQGKARVAQVDGVVAAILGGAASPDTRRILESGEHPLAAAARQSASSATVDANGGMSDDSAGDAAMAVARVKANNKQGGLLGARAAGRNAIVGAVPQLDGFAQVVGLALGSPEFQRR